MIGTLSRDEIDRLLREQRVGRLACTVDDQPYVVPINYSYDGRHIYAYSSIGRKIEIMRRQPRVCLQVDDVTGSSVWRSVVIQGQYEELDGESERRAALAVLAPAGSALVSRGLNGASQIVVFRISPTDVTGRFERQKA